MQRPPPAATVAAAATAAPALPVPGAHAVRATSAPLMKPSGGAVRIPFVLPAGMPLPPSQSPPVTPVVGTPIIITPPFPSRRSSGSGGTSPASSDGGGGNAAGTMSKGGSVASGYAVHGRQTSGQLHMRVGHGGGGGGGGDSSTTNSTSTAVPPSMQLLVLAPASAAAAAAAVGIVASNAGSTTAATAGPRASPTSFGEVHAHLSRHAHAVVGQVKALLPRHGTEMTPTASWLRAILFFLMYALQGVPVALIDFHVRRAWRDTGMPPSVDRLWYAIMYWPYLVRCVVAFLVDGVLPRETRAKRRALFRLLHALTAAMCASLAAASMCPIAPGDATPTSMWLLLVIMAGTSVIAACSDVLLDSLGFEAASLDGDDASRNAMQIIAFKCGKFGVQLAVAWMLVELELSWLVSLRWCLAAAVAVLAFSLAVHRRLFAVPAALTPGDADGEEWGGGDGHDGSSASDDSGDEASGPGGGDGDGGCGSGNTSSSSSSNRGGRDADSRRQHASYGVLLRKFWRTAAAAVRFLRGTRSGRALLALAVLHKFGEMVFRDQMGSLQDAHFRAEISAAVPGASAPAVAATQKAVSMHLANVIGWLDISVTVLPSLAATLAAWWAASPAGSPRPHTDGSAGPLPARQSNRSLTILFASMAGVALVRSLSLLRLADIAGDEAAPMLVPPPALAAAGAGGGAATATALAAWRDASLTPTWTVPLLVSAATTGLATSLFYIAAMSGVTMIVAEAPAAAPLRISMYSILEVADDLARALGAVTAGVLVGATGTHAPAFLVGSLFTLAPVAIACLLWRHAARIPVTSPASYPAILAAG